MKLTVDQIQRINDSVPLAHKLANKHKRKSESFEEILSEVYWGMVHAATGYDPNKGNWASYCNLWAKGYIARHRRRNERDCIVASPRSRHPEQEPKVSGYCVSDLVFPSAREENDTYEVGKLLELVDRLTRRVIERKYLEGKTFPEIGEEVGLSPSRVSKICRDGIAEIAEKCKAMNAEMSDF